MLYKIIGIVDGIGLSTAVPWAATLKIYTSFFFFIVTAVFGSVIMFDIGRKFSKRKIKRPQLRRLLCAKALALYSLAGFGLARAVDGISDKWLLEQNAEITTTISQQSWAYEASLFVAGLFLVYNMIVYIRYYQKVAHYRATDDRRDNVELTL